MKKTLGQVLNGVVILIACVLVLLAYGSLNNRGYRVITVEGNSMSPTFRFGDELVITPPTATIPKGTIITMSVDGALVTHRLIADFQGGRPETKGDANNAADQFPGNLEIVGIVRLRIPGIGYPGIYLHYLLGKI